MDRLGDTEGGQEYFRKAVEISRACHAKKPDDDGYKGELANSLGMLARSEIVLGHLEKAREFYREEIAVRESFSPAKANDRESRRELAGHYAQLAELTVMTGDRAGAQSLYDRCAGSANRWRRKCATPRLPRTISPCRTTSRIRAFSPRRRPGSRTVVSPQST